MAIYFAFSINDSNLILKIFWAFPLFLRAGPQKKWAGFRFNLFYFAEKANQKRISATLPNAH
jgi:hypothetical protein